MVLQTERLIVRPWKKADVEQLFMLAKDPHVGPPCGWTPHENLKESREVLRDILMNEYTYAILLKETEMVIGNVALMPYCESRFAQSETEAELGFWLGYPYWGNGYMAEACKCLLEHGFTQKNLSVIWCAHNLDNYNSMRVQEKCGFVFHHEDVYYERELAKKIRVKVNCVKKEERG
ncbi:MAG: GNAT family N-acetyltransferase [Agathobacter sp.]|nr:GNAT family N-acetyltransferase [Agathobacter sp.]